MSTSRRIAGRPRPGRSPIPTQPTPKPEPAINDVSPPSEPTDTTAVSDVDVEETSPILFTPEQAAKLLHVRESWLRRRAAARAVPCRFLGKHLRFAKQDIDEIAEASRQPPRTPPGPVTRYGNPPRRA